MLFDQRSWIAKHPPTHSAVGTVSNEAYFSVWFLVINWLPAASGLNFEPFEFEALI